MKYKSSLPVAVLIALYRNDRQEWFEQAILSIISQDYGFNNIQVYLGVDGPIGDGLEKTIKNHLDCFHKIIRNNQNVGLAKTLNRLIESLGDEKYIFRMDSDDIALPYRFSCQIAFMENHPEVDVLGAAIWEFTDESSVFWKKTYPTRHEEINRYITKANPIAHSTVCFRSRFFEKIPKYPDSFKINQDLVLWNIALRNGIRFANLEQPMLCLRTSPEFFARRGLARAMSEFQLYLSATYYHYGPTWRLVFPLLRFLLRLLPAPVARIIYQSKYRNLLSRRNNSETCS